MHFKAIHRKFALRNSHYTRDVEQQVNPLALMKGTIRERGDRLQIGEIGLLEREGARRRETVQLCQSLTFPWPGLVR